jgi:homogentisate 1,2-dioxygenase
MPIYHRLGKIPRKRHSVFRKNDGTLYTEELVGSHGFSGSCSLLYHVRPPTSVTQVAHRDTFEWEPDDASALRLRHFRTYRLHTSDSPILDRTPILFNHDVALSVVRAQGGESPFYRNAQGDELIFAAEGKGVLESQMGELPFKQGDYLVIPRGILHRYRIDSSPVRFLIFESTGQIRTPSRYRSEHGQLLEISPYCERDIRLPESLPVYEEQGEFCVIVKARNSFTEVTLDHHPFDVVGWDGYYYPWALNIEDFEPRTGRFHLPPPVHQTFEGDGFVVCSFCPRPFDFDPSAIPAPYNHSNVMCDEVIYYANSEFMSRRGIEQGSITLHPGGLPHGPQPGRTEESIGRPSTEELAVMLDTFRPLKVSKKASALEDPDYYLSWIERNNA